MKKNRLFLILLTTPLLLGCRFIKGWDSGDSAAVKYYKTKELSLKGAENGNSEADDLLKYLSTFASTQQIDNAGKKKYGVKFFLTFVQESCAMCEDQYGGFKTLEKKWGKITDFSLSGDNGLGNEPFKMYTLFIDKLNSDDNSLFEYFYNSGIAGLFFSDAFSSMNGFKYTHPYLTNGGEYNYAYKLDDLNSYDSFTTPTTFVIDLTEEGSWGWRSSYGVKEVIFDIAGNDDFARARTLRDAWTNNPSEDNIFSINYHA